VSPQTIFNALSTIPRLKKLNLSRNRFEAWHGENRFPKLEELYFAFNAVPEEAFLIPAVVQNPTLVYLVVTGNPFATQL